MAEIHDKQYENIVKITPEQCKNVKLGTKAKHEFLCLLRNRNVSVSLDDDVQKRYKKPFFNPQISNGQKWGSLTKNITQLDENNKNAAKKFYLKDKPWVKKGTLGDS